MAVGLGVLLIGVIGLAVAVGLEIVIEAKEDKEKDE